ncbi:hypothetical protein [Halostella litorea]|uniref:hypothetical protein n=1 Tax=Halostella litorea TaxID=2528831 RepID=UPI001091AA16|nr:hypothetical protein [Halostella litorea]
MHENTTSYDTEQNTNESPIECKICGDAIAGVPLADVMYEIEIGRHTETVTLCDECALKTATQGR